MLKKNPVRIFGLVYIYILITGFAVGIYYVKTMNYVERQTVPAALADTTTIPEIKLTEPKIVPAVDLAKLENPDQQMISKGRDLYNGSCFSCHGEGGMGDGVAGSALNPKPRNFRNSEGWINGSTLLGIYKTLQEGIPGSGMISYNYMPPEDRLAIAQFIRTNFIRESSVSKDELVLLDQTYNLSAGRRISGQIPVSDAISIYLSENQSKTEKVISSLRIMSETDKEDGELFHKIVTDKIKALAVLSATSGDWKENKNIMKMLILHGVNRDGFNGEVYKLNGGEWDRLYSLLRKVI